LIEGVDKGSGPMNLSQAWSAGRRFAIVYVPTGVDWKDATPQMVHALHAAGWQVVFNCERTASWMHGGYSAGQSAAQVCINFAAACGVARRFLYLSDDESDGFSPDEQQCAAGAAATLGGRQHVGIYNSVAAGPTVRSLGYKLWLAVWPTNPGSFPPVPYVPDIWQYKGNVQFAGALVDFDRAYAADYGQLWLPPPAPKAPPFPGAFAPGDKGAEVGTFFRQLHHRFGWRFGYYIINNYYDRLKRRACVRFVQNFKGYFAEHGLPISPEYGGKVLPAIWKGAWAI
jgi:hypothetical protein